MRLDRTESASLVTVQGLLKYFVTIYSTGFSWTVCKIKCFIMLGLHSNVNP